MLCFRVHSPAVFLVILCAVESIRIGDQEASNDEISDFNPNLGKGVSKVASGVVHTVKPARGLNGFAGGLKNVQLSNGLKGFQFQGKPSANIFNNGFARPPSYAFNGFRSQIGHGFGGFGGQLGRMPQSMGRMPTTGAKRFASTNAQIVRAVERAAGEPTRQKMGQSIRESFWHIFKFPNNDVHVLISEAEMQLSKVAQEGVARFKIRHGGKDLYVTLLKRSGFTPPFKTALNYGHGTVGDGYLLRNFGKGLYRLQNIFQPKSLEYISQQVHNVLKSGGSEAGMARQLESLVQQKWGQGWNVVVSASEMTMAVNTQDVMAAFKARLVREPLSPEEEPYTWSNVQWHWCEKVDFLQGHDSLMIALGVILAVTSLITMGLALLLIGISLAGLTVPLTGMLPASSAAVFAVQVLVMLGSSEHVPLPLKELATPLAVPLSPDSVLWASFLLLTAVWLLRRCRGPGPHGLSPGSWELRALGFVAFPLTVSSTQLLLRLDEADSPLAGFLLSTVLLCFLLNQAASTWGFVHKVLQDGRVVQTNMPDGCVGGRVSTVFVDKTCDELGSMPVNSSQGLSRSPISEWLKTPSWCFSDPLAVVEEVIFFEDMLVQQQFIGSARARADLRASHSDLEQQEASADELADLLSRDQAEADAPTLAFDHSDPSNQLSHPSPNAMRTGVSSYRGRTLSDEQRVVGKAERMGTKLIMLTKQTREAGQCDWSANCPLPW
eukprot:Skav227894  [mRNA]  locus=scaffold1951:153110:158045:- [translate_table: standard]